MRLRSLSPRAVIGGLLLGIGALLLPAQGVAAATITVTSDADPFTPVATDGCTLREAIQAANTDAAVNECPAGSGADAIAFAIPGDGMKTIALQRFPPTIENPVTIDGYTQSGAKPNTLAVGSDAVFRITIDGNRSQGFVVMGARSTIRGLVLTNFESFSGTIQLYGEGGHAVRGNHIIQNTATALTVGSRNNVVGGTTPADRNVIADNTAIGSDTQFTVRVAGESNRVQGNYIGVDPSGITHRNNVENGDIGGGFGAGVGVEGTANVIGGAETGARNVIADGIMLGYFSPATGASIQGNYIGVNATGATRTAGGIQLLEASNTQIGGTTEAARNIIAGGITASPLVTGTTIQGNYIGTNAAGTSGLGPGISIAGATNTTIGGLVPGAGNLIRNTTTAGVAVSSGAGVSILGNAIFQNAGLGIDLGAGGVTPNDAGDGDTGPNGLQNFPALTSASTESTTTTVVGSLNSTPSRSLRVEFFVNADCDPSGSGEGQRLVHAVNVNTNASGIAPINTTIPPLAAGQFLTATATNLTTNETSEFSACVLIRPRESLTGKVQQISSSGVYLPTDTRGPAGVYRITFGFRNISPQVYADLQARITELTGGHTVVNRDGWPTSTPAGVGAVVTVPNTALGPDDQLTPNETFTQVIEVGLQRRESFKIGFAGSGRPVGVGAASRTAGRGGDDIDDLFSGGGEFTPSAFEGPPGPQPPTQPGPNACAPRPKIEVKTDQTGPGQIQATITTQATAGAPNNAIKSVRLTGVSNAEVRVVGGDTLASGATSTPPAGSREVRLLVTRQQAGPMTAHLEITDGCGSHTTFVGGGAGLR